MTTSRTLEVDGLRLHYLEEGEGEPVLLLHGWPTSSYLYRDILPVLGRGRRAIALDLPGFGRSDKPLDVSYSFRFFDRVLDGFTAALGIARTGLVVHDLGGPIGLHWAVGRPARLSRLALLNTIVYPEMSWAVMAFVAAARLPGLRALVTSPRGLAAAMRLGVGDRRRLSDEAVRAVQEPFASPEARRALALAGCGLHPDGFKDIARGLRSLGAPTRIIYGARDRILPDVARTMRRVAADVPGTEITVLEDCGHFLQEERPAEIAALLAAFFAA